MLFRRTALLNRQSIIEGGGTRLVAYQRMQGRLSIRKELELSHVQQRSLCYSAPLKQSKVPKEQEDDEEKSKRSSSSNNNNPVQVFSFPGGFSIPWTNSPIVDAALTTIIGLTMSMVL